MLDVDLLDDVKKRLDLGNARQEKVFSRWRLSQNGEIKTYVCICYVISKGKTVMWINSRSFCGSRDEADILLMTKGGCVQLATSV